jgi:alcohol dehydrogenase class IV
MCLASTVMALHHKLCHVLGGAFDLPHAETHAIVLPHVAAYNGDAAPEAMRRVARALGADRAADGLHALLTSLDVPIALKDIGMPEDGIGRAVELAMREPYWNPREIEERGLRELIGRALRGEPPAARTWRPADRPNVPQM